MVYRANIPVLSEEDYLLKEYLYEYIVKKREFTIRLPRPPKKEIWKGKEALREEYQKIAERVFSNEEIAEILADQIVGPAEFKRFVKLMSNELQSAGIQEARNVAIRLAMSLMGYDDLGFLLLDDNIEEITVNGPRDVYVYHKRKGYLKTNIAFPSVADILEIIEQIAHIHGKVLDEEHPFLDATLPDGSRVNATLPTVTPESPTITIRKFSRKKLSILDLIQNGTITVEAAAYLWVAIEGLRMYPMNILVIGGTASGKTTLLNALLAFIPKNSRIITVEDTREIYVSHRNRVHMVTYEGITMNDLLKNTLRMRPDRIIVGEVRGEEAITLFQAMDVGHRGVLGTLHANDAVEARQRITHAPMNVPEDMLPLVNYYVVMKQYPDGGRRVKEIVESVRGENVVAYGKVFETVDGALKMTGSIGQNMDVLAREADTTRKSIMEEIERRKEYLEALLEKKLDYLGAFKAINRYYVS